MNCWIRIPLAVSLIPPYLIHIHADVLKELPHVKVIHAGIASDINFIFRDVPAIKCRNILDLFMTPDLVHLMFRQPVFRNDEG